MLEKDITVFLQELKFFVCHNIVSSVFFQGPKKAKKRSTFSPLSPDLISKAVNFNHILSSVWLQSSPKLVTVLKMRIVLFTHTLKPKLAFYGMGSAKVEI